MVEWLMFVDGWLMLVGGVVDVCCWLFVSQVKVSQPVFDSQDEPCQWLDVHPQLVIAH